MAGNTLGKIFTLSSFGESHGTAIGGMVDGCPAGLQINIDEIQYDLNLRKPGQSNLTTPRQEEDKIEILSGIFEGKTLGTPIGFMIRNQDQKSADYESLKEVYRPSHADFTYQQKYGIRDYRGGGRQSARETACRVVAGSIAKQMLVAGKIEFLTFTSQIGSIKFPFETAHFTNKDIHSSLVRCPDASVSKQMEAYIQKIKEEGDSVGGIVTCIIKNVPIGLGEPVFDKLQADLAKAMLSINATKGFQYGLGFEGVDKKGSEYNDTFENIDGKIKPKTNYSGGILGGISTGEDIVFQVAFKPASSIAKNQTTVDATGKEIALSIQGRHDPCIVPRAVAVVEAMAALVLADHFLRNKLAQL